MEVNDMKNNIIHIDFSKRASELRYLIKNELTPDRAWKRQERKIFMAVMASMASCKIKIFPLNL
jgi:hypothetical protein